MAVKKSSNNMSNVALTVLLLLVASQVMPSHGTPLLVNRRYLLRSATSTASTMKGMIEGTVTPTEGGVPAATEDVGPLTEPQPRHRSCIHHNKIGRKLLMISQ
ncbi:hypothetical protein GQ55_9G451900 [Panicum hallii var. hallii]|uniref:Uncharacterized protein n=1 Tax=Panicum hallii var. hallii TaxID=1504633 RepID=A0A2T7CBT7_9POAL|nr:hypothetical protein GQ55_9G451900 [Panicum hallii var. hallii]